MLCTHKTASSASLVLEICPQFNNSYLNQFSSISGGNCISYPKVVHIHYAFRDMIDNHNSQRMHPISLEETWMTTRWLNCVFCFLLAVSVVNVQNAGEYFCALQNMDALSARKLIAQQLIENKYMRTVEEWPSKRPQCRKPYHCLVTLPTGKNRKWVTGYLQEQISNLEMRVQACPC